MSFKNDSIQSDITNTYESTQVDTSQSITSTINDDDLKYSQNIIINSQFNNNKDNLIRLIINKNDNLNKKLNKILNIINKSDSKELEFLFIAKNENIQKLITIIEILKQKLNKKQTKQTHNTNFKNDKFAKIDNLNNVYINNTQINLNYSNFKQFNILDYTTIQKSELKGKNSGDFNDLKLNKFIKLPVFYIYLNLNNYNKVDDVPLQYTNKCNRLISDGWTVQNE
ncbi:hypothetical protein CANARDRAFT_191888 [[Candida] arabinofermentans NRRL YB-2248]|uniref:Uncharacterized protein n=1 Tax=[Candida] arabinofermentans NRRL YB-2248 TaxID=983967 RepID=A0A1E4SXF3_9ASCO|nr:hypothetical protein CANARDRAFT_191888 [[Candida] arabinofermentans NRRL YB-2248]